MLVFHVGADGEGDREVGKEWGTYVRSLPVTAGRHRMGTMSVTKDTPMALMGME